MFCSADCRGFRNGMRPMGTGNGILGRPDSRRSSTTPQGRCSGVVGQEPTGRVRGARGQGRAPRSGGGSAAKRLDRGEHTRTLRGPTMPPMDTIHEPSPPLLPTDSAEHPEIVSRAGEGQHTATGATYARFRVGCPRYGAKGACPATPSGHRPVPEQRPSTCQGRVRARFTIPARTGGVPPGVGPGVRRA